MNIPLVIRSIITVIMLIWTANAHAALIVGDDFEQGGQSFWTELTSATISSERSKGGSRSLRFRYPGVPLDEDGWAEARFDLGNYYEELSIRFDLYIPSNYYHRDPPAGNNNKFFRLWGENYDDREKIGATLYDQGSIGESKIGADYRKEADWGMSSGIVNAGDFITMADRGKWMSIVIYIKAATDTADAKLWIYKNGQPLFKTSPPINHNPGTQGYRLGYLLGWANTGYSEETLFYMDNVEFHDNNIMENAPKSPVSILVN